MIAFISEWILVIFSIAFMLGSFVFNEHKRFFSSFTMMAISIGCYVNYDLEAIKIAVEQYGSLKAGIQVGLGYLVGALVTSFIYWAFYVLQVKHRLSIIIKEKVPKRVESLLKKGYEESSIDYLNAYAKADVIGDNLQWIFIDAERDLNVYNRFPSFSLLDLDSISIDRQLTINKIEDSIAKFFPPRFSDCYIFILGAGCSWPITLVWLLISKVIKNGVRTVLNMFESVFNTISTGLFGKI